VQRFFSQISADSTAELNYEFSILNVELIGGKMSKSDNVILDKSFEFSLMILKIYQKLKSKSEFDVARQLLRAGTSIGANVEESLAAYSRKDFNYKMGIASREARETRYWMRLIQKGKILTIPKEYFNEIDEINSILTSIVKTTSESLNKK
jgi:four helix bundle protein